MRAIHRFAEAIASFSQYGRIIAGCLLLALPSLTAAQTPISGQSVPSLSQLDTIMQTYMTQYSSPGASLAVSVDGRLVFARGYGYAKVDTGEFVQPDSLYRIASNSKPITAAGIYQLIAQGKLSLTTQPFATILNNLTPPPGTTIDPRYATITIQELLQHTAGFDDTIIPDPAQSNAVIAATTFGANAPATPQLLIKYMLGQPLQHDPGTTYAYSNFGYITLGYIIEQVSGMPYATYIQNNVFTPAGISRTQPGASLLSGRLPSEVAYYDYPGAPLVPSVEPPVGTQVPYPYGGYSCTLQLANGCWVSSTIDLLRFVDSINGQFSTNIFATPPSSSPFRSPQLYFAVPPTGPGWEYVFYGSLPGTNSITHLITDTTTTGKVTYSVIFNTRNGANIEEPESDADNAILAFVQTVKSWPTGDLFPTYSGTASSCSFTLASTSQSVTANGNTFTVGLTDANYCAWSSVSNASWIHVTAGALNSDSGYTGYTVDANTGASRTGTITIAGQTFTVTQSGVTTPTTLVVNSSASTITSGQSVTLTATLAPFSAGSNSTNGETVTFASGGASIGTAMLTGGIATLTTSSLAAGTDSITASFAGDSTFSAANATSIQVTVNTPNKTATALALAAVPSSGTYGQSVSLTATLTPFSSGSNTTNGETVTFFNGGTAIGTATFTGGAATLTTTALPAGTDSLTAVYAGDTNFTGSNAALSFTESKAAATVTLGGLTATYSGTAHAVTATTTPTGLSIGFTYNGSATAPTAAGSYPIIATISDPNYTGTTTGTLVISKAAATVTLGGLSATFDGTAHAATATTVPAGLSVNLTYNGSATAPSAAGSYSVVATITDPNYTGSATGTLAITTPLAASSTTLTSSASSVPAGTSVTLTATVKGSSGTPTGTVTFLNGSTSLGTGTLNGSGVATLTTSLSAAGTDSITAQYSGDATFSASTSSAVPVTVVAVGISATVSPIPLTIKSGSSGTMTITLTPTGGYTGTVSLSCGTLPAHVSCAFAPTSVAITSSTTAATDILTINTATAPLSAMHSTTHLLGQGSGIYSAMTLGLPGSLLALFGLKRRKQYPALRRLLMLALFCLATAGIGALSGCGTSGDLNSTTAVPGSYTVPVTLTLSAGTSQIVNATVIIQ